jgi:calcium-dependent protein kinase
MFNKENFINNISGQLTDHYKIIQEIGQGSYGKVFQVVNKISNEKRACKQLPKGRIKNMDQFMSEINILKKTDHPNIIKLFEHFEDNRYIYLVMEECTGGELFDKIIDKLQSGTIFTEKEAAKIFKQMISAIAYCHAEGICHRDLKPENLLLVNKKDDSNIKVIDFGLSNIFKDPKKKESLKMTTKVGTAYYVSPEVLAGNYDEKCDIWSAGVILYIILCGDPPFNGKNDNEIYQRIKEKKFSFTKNKIWDKISQDVKNLITEMLSGPKDRPTAEKVLQHKWVSELAPNSNEALLKLDIDSMKSFSNTNKIKKAVLTFVASRLKEDDLSVLKEIFETLDKNGDGHLTLDELKEGLSKIGKGSGTNIEELFKNMDTDGSGSINYTGNYFIFFIY